MIKPRTLQNQALDARAAQFLATRDQRLRPLLASTSPDGNRRSLAELATDGPKMVCHPIALARWRAA